MKEHSVLPVLRIFARRRRALAVLAFAGLVVQPLLALPEPLADDLAQRTMFELKTSDSGIVEAAFARIEKSGDRRFIAPLIELLRADQIPIVQGFERKRLVELLEKLAGVRLGGDWGEWLLWYSDTDPAELEPPPGFIGWKGALYSRIDPAFGALMPLGIPTRIRAEEIVWGGVRFEGIPALDDPKTVAADSAAASYLLPNEPVFGIALGDEARAYPLRILDWHEMANDTVGGVPFSLAYCTLCGSGIAYDRRASDGMTYDFGSSGFLMRSNKLMVDRTTRTLWNQLTGEPVLGPLLDGPPLRLGVLPSVVTTWAAWKRRHPNTTVLSLETGHERPYEIGAAYADYFADAGLMFPVRTRNRKVPAKLRVFGLQDGAAAKAWSLDVLAAAGVVNDVVGELPVVLVASGGLIDVQGKSVRSGEERRYRAGLEVRAYRRGKLELRQSESQGIVDGSGNAWQLQEDALVAANGARLERVPGISAFWFGWSAYYPHSEIVQGDAR